MELVSAIIPVLNEAARLPRLLRRLRAMPQLAEVIVVDGGSRDASARVAGAYGARLVRHGVADRAAQLNAGAAVARSSVLWFLHADTVPAHMSALSIAEALAAVDVVGGSFRRRFISNLKLLRWTTLGGDLRARMLGVSFGDQAQFVRRDVFRFLGGFANCERAEDMEFALRLRRLGRVVCLGPPVHSSARRFDVNPWRTVVVDAWLTWRFWRSPPYRNETVCR